jgi:SAM-dependent methyltransferase
MNALPANVVVRTSLQRDYGGYSLTDGEMLRTLSQAETRHFWQLSRNCFIDDQLARLGVFPGARLLELGCGGGCVAAHISWVLASDRLPDGHLPRILEAAARAPRARFIVEDLTQKGVLSDEKEFDVVALFDVIEHLEDPKAALTGALEHARSGGYVVGTVPALMALWSDVDRRAGHRLRYERKSLAGLLGSLAGATQVEVTPFNRLLVPLTWLQRRSASKQKACSGGQYYRVPWAPINAALYALLRLEYWTSSWVPASDRLPGASLWFAIQKR